MRIGKLALVASTPTSTLRYERAGLLPPPERTGAGYRDCATSDICSAMCPAD